MKLMRRIISVVIAVSMLAGAICISRAADEIPHSAYATLGKNLETKDMKVTLGKTGTTSCEIVEAKGRDGWKMPFARNEQSAIYVNLDKSFAWEVSDYLSYDVEIDYFDEGKGKFRILYDAMPNPWRKNGESGLNQTAMSDIVYLEDSGEWKTANLRLEMPRFGDGLYGHDFCVTLHEPNMGLTAEEVTFGSIKVTPAKTRASVRATAGTDVVGNNFFEGEKVKINFDIYNQTKKDEKVTVSMVSYDFDGNRDYEDSFEIEIGAKKKESKIIEIEPSRYSIYRMNYQIEGDGIYSDGFIDYGYSWQNERKNPKLGYNNHMYRIMSRNPDKLIPLMSKMGVGSNREGIWWPHYERQKGVYALPERADHTMSLLDEYGIDQMLILQSGADQLVEFYGVVDGMPVTEEAQQAFVNYAVDQAKRFKGQVYRFELLNERNMHTQNGHDGVWYGKLAKRVYKAIKEVNPDIVFTIGVSAGIAETWMKEVVQAAEGCFDEYSFHYYGNFDARTVDFYNMAKTVRGILDENGAEDIPINISETGYNSVVVDKRQQAAYCAQLYSEYMAPELGVSIVYFYNFQNDGYYPEDTEMNFGAIETWDTVDTPYLIKPVYLTLTTVNRFLTGAEVVDKTETEDGSYYHYAKDDGSDVLVAWTRKNSEYISVSLGSNDVKVYDMYGNELEIYRENGIYSMTITDEPVYFVGNFNDYNVTAQPLLSLSGTEFDLPYGDIIDIEVLGELSDDLKINVNLPDDGYVEVHENDGFKNGKAVIKLSGHGVTGEQSVAYVTVSDKNDKVYLNAKIVLNYTDAVDVDFRTEPYGGQSMNRWLGIFTVKNNSHIKPISGKIIFNAPSDLKNKIKYVDIPEIQPNDTKEIRFNLPEVNYGKSYFIDSDLKLDDGYGLHLNLYADVSCAVYAYKKPVIDGVISDGEWSGCKKLFLGDENVNYASGFLEYDGYKGNNDLSADVKYMWDEKNLYMLCEVTDDVFYQKETSWGIWQGDSIQLGVYYGGKENKDQTLFTELGLALTPNGEYVAKFSTEPGATMFTENRSEGKFTELKVFRDRNKTVYEARIPWGEMINEETNLVPGDSVRFNMIINDNDGKGRWGWVEYGDGIGWVKDGSKFGYLRLLDNNKR